ncbi:YkvA family protein [Psychroflexus tropicus]|uniref:YkvA family protein n=1 Tax=Psychroflexus tropicus TaxID=197345 RepID=UPI0003A2B074|nr:YkvA family protein [Psychroflexus tropicus]
MKKKKKVDKRFVKEGIETVSETDFETVFDKKDQLFAKLNHPDWKKYKEKVILMFQFLKDVKQKNYPQTPWRTLAAMIFAVIYIINPLDLVPDFIPFLGYLDDITVFGFILKMINHDLEAYENWKSEEELVTEKPSED